MRRLSGDHEVLEIDGGRLFAYRSVYFDTPDLRCFHDHVDGERPRFKARTRHYRDTGVCHFEVKLKVATGETDKRQIDHAPARAEELTAQARELLGATLRDAGVDVPPFLEPALRTSFDRVTIAARDNAARLTCDLGVAMQRIDGVGAAIRDGRVLVESKSEDGEAAADRILDELGCATVSLSKYRTGIDVLVERDRSGDADAIRPLFAVRD